MSATPQSLSGLELEAPLSMDPDAFRRQLLGAAHWVADYLERVHEGPVTRPRTDEQRRAQSASPLRESGGSPADLLAFVDKEIAPYPCGNGHPAFFAWINTPPAPVGVVAELIAAALNPSCGMGEHALVDLERGTVRALADLAGLPDTTGGVLTSGGSMANLLCLSAARTWFLKSIGAHDSPDFGRAHARLVCYQSGDTHLSVAKTARTMGLAAARLRTVPVDSAFRMDPVALRAAVQADKDAGLLPFCVVSTVGSTATGAVDPLEQITAVCRDFGLWHHVDGAYGGLGAAHPELAEHYRGIAEVDSLTVDPHKTLNVPIGCGAALVTDPDRLREAFSAKASYLEGNEAWPWLSDYSVELTRPAGRVLSLWAVLHQLGRTGVVELLDQYLRRTAFLRSIIGLHPEVELITDGPWSVTCFRYRPGLRAPSDAFTAELARRIQENGRAFLATVEVKGRLVLRASICGHTTTELDVCVLMDEVLSIGAELAKRAGL